MNETKDRILRVLRATGHPGIEAVISYLETSSYFTRGCYGHHKEHGGLAQHSIEVYDYMAAHAGLFPSDSVAVIALLHDLGKTVRRDGTGHGHRSVRILDGLGFELTPAERKAIGNHHDHNLIDYAVCPLLCLLSAGDCDSTGRWKREEGPLDEFRKWWQPSMFKKYGLEELTELGISILNDSQFRDDLDEWIEDDPSFMEELIPVLREYDAKGSKDAHALLNTIEERGLLDPS